MATALDPQAYNRSGGLSEAEQAQRLEMLKDLLGSIDASRRPFIEPPFNCDYGYNIHLGRWAQSQSFMAGQMS